MLSTRFQLVFAASAAATPAGLVQIPFNTQAGHLSPDVDSPWPTLRLGYQGSQENLTLNTYLTFSNASLLVRPQTCADEMADARYFPCSQRKFEWGNGRLTWPRLGRAFLQSAFMASHFKYDDNADTMANYWLAQAPGPASIEENATEGLTEVASGTMPNRTGVKLEANAWTKSWSSVPPVWTLDHDGVTTLDQLNAAPGATQQANLGVKVAVPIAGTVAILLALFFGVRGIHRSRVNNARIKLEISE
ncbi:hypothetical protein GGR58DRAFT_503511 [Xylaria digitata]|nr:hypothetical protein GGR58DRAFT_503511 [Xylaria digitata]